MIHVPKVKRFLQELQTRYPHMPIKRMWKKWQEFNYPTKKVFGFFEGYVSAHADMYPPEMVVGGSQK